MLDRYRILMMPADGDGGDGGGGDVNPPDPTAETARAKAEEERLRKEMSKYKRGELRDAQELLELEKKLNAERQEALNKQQQYSDEKRKQIEQEIAAIERALEGENLLDNIIEEKEQAKIRYQERLQVFDEKKQAAAAEELRLKRELEKVEEKKKKNRAVEFIQRLEADGKSQEIMKKTASIQTVFKESFGKGKGGFLGQAVQSFESLSEFMDETKVAMDEAGGASQFFKNSFSDFKTTIAKAAPLIGLAMVKMGMSVGLQIDNLNKDINRATGFAADFHSTLMGTSRSLAGLGVSLEDASKAIQSVSKNIASFTPQNKLAYKSLFKTFAVLEKIGVSSDGAAKAFNFFEKSMQPTEQTAENLTIQLATMGEKMGIVAEKVMSDFTSSLDRLSIYGDNAINVFKGLSKAAKLAGLEMSSLLSATEKFDKFDSAADSVAKLNAVLGTQLSTMEMMNMDDAQRIMTIKTEVQSRLASNNKQFKDLNKFEKMYIAQAMGLKSVDEAQRLLNMNSEAYYKGEMEGKKTREELQRHGQNFAKTMEKLKVIMFQLTTLMEPFVQAVYGISAGFDLIAGALGMENQQFLKYFGYVLVAITIALIAMTGPIGAAVALFMGLVYVIGLVYDALHEDGSPQLWQLPAAMGENFMTMADGVDNATGRLGKSVGALDNLWSIFHKPGSPMLYALPLAFAEGFISIGESVAKATGQLNEFISLMLKVAQLDFKGFIALRTDSSGTSMVMGSESVLTSISEGKLRVDVNMPEFTMPEVHVKVYIGKEELKGMINKEATLVAKKLKLGRT
jgi:hypothetical protein